MTRIDLSARLCSEVVVLLKNGKVAKAAEVSRKALEIVDQLARERPADRYVRGYLGEAHLRSGQVSEAAGDRFGAATHWRESIEKLQTIPRITVSKYVPAGVAPTPRSQGWARKPELKMSSSEARAEADAAMVLLKKAVDMGFRSAGTFIPSRLSIRCAAATTFSS